MNQLIFLDKVFFNAVTIAGCNVEATRSLDEIAEYFTNDDLRVIGQQSNLLSGFSFFRKTDITPFRPSVNMTVGKLEEMVSPFMDQPINQQQKLESLSVIVNLNGDIILTDYTEEETPLHERIICGLAKRYDLAYAMRSPFWKP